MKIFTGGRLVAILFLMLTTLHYATLENGQQQLSSSRTKIDRTLKDAEYSKKLQPKIRVQRQNRQRRPPGLFNALNQLIGGTVVDTFTGYRNISRLVQTAFAPPQSTTGNVTTPVNGTTFTLRQALALLGRNYRGLRRLYETELTKALSETQKNVHDFKTEFKNSARLFLEYGNSDSNRI